MKFLVIATGGTIASVETPDGLKPGISGEQIVSCYGVLSEDDTVDVIDFFAKDSTNICPADWFKIAECINGHADYFDATIVLHGTDTMAWTSTALSFLTDSSVVLTGSMFPFGTKGSDAPLNINAAFAFARGLADAKIRRVGLAFGKKLFDGARVSKINSSSNDPFYGCPAWGEPQIFKADKNLPLKKIALVPIFPGMDANNINAIINENPNALVLEGFGSGGVPFDILPCIEKAVRQGIKVVLGTSSPMGGADPTHYEVGVRALRAGAVSAGANTREALVVKLMFGLDI